MTRSINAREQDCITLSVAPCVPGGIGVEISQGCNNGCIYCFSACDSGQEQEAGSDQALMFFRNVPEILDSFLSKHESQVRNVHLGYVTDFMQQDGPVPEAIRHAVLDVLLKYEDVYVSCLTKGTPTFETIQKINKMSDRFTLMLDAGCGSEIWETNVDPLKARCRAFSELTCNIAGRLDPIIPTVSDTDVWFKYVCEQLSKIGINDIDSSFLFLTDEVAEEIESKFGLKYLEAMYEYYSNGDEEYLNSAVQWTGEKIDMKDIRYKIDTIALLSPDSQYRLEILSRFQTIANQYGITVRLCSCKNKSMIKATGFCSDCRALKERKCKVKMTA